MDADGIRFLIDMHRRGILPAPGAVAEIGAQELWVESEPAVLREFLTQFGSGGAVTDKELHALAQRGPARRLFELAQWSYDCVDTSAAFGAMALDLNFDEIPSHRRGRYDLVTNFGCTEHIANQLNAFKAIHDLAKPGALMVHVVPSQGFFDHGLLNYTGKFFWRLAEFNDYRLIDMRLTEHGEAKRIPEAFSYVFSVFDRSCELRDTIIWAAFQKTRGDGFVPPFDGAIASAELSRRYPRALVEKYNALDRNIGG